MTTAEVLGDLTVQVIKGKDLQVHTYARSGIPVGPYHGMTCTLVLLPSSSQVVLSWACATAKAFLQIRASFGTVQGPSRHSYQRNEKSTIIKANCGPDKTVKTTMESGGA